MSSRKLSVNGKHQLQHRHWCGRNKCPPRTIRGTVFHWEEQQSKPSSFRGSLNVPEQACVKEECPEVIKGLGKMPNVYKIQLHERVKPFSSATPCRPPLPMTEKVQAERKGMQRENIIWPVTTPTFWCAPKSGWSVWTWMNLIKENEIMRLKNDCSQELSAFIPLNRRFCFKRFPFGIYSGPDVIHREMNDILTGIPCDVDDVLLSGEKPQRNTITDWKQYSKKQNKRTKNPEWYRTRSASLQQIHTVHFTRGITTGPVNVETSPENVSELRWSLAMVMQTRRQVGPQPDWAHQVRAKPAEERDCADLISSASRDI